LFQSLNLDDSGDLSGVEPPQSALNPGIIGLPVAIFTCRSDTTGVTGTNYRVCMGTTPGFHQELTANPENSARLGSFSFFGRRIGEITDGLSQTSLMAERVQGDRRPNVYAPSRDTAIVSGLSSTLPNDVASGCRTVSASQPHYSFGGSAWIYSGYAHTWYNDVHTPNSITPDCAGAVQPSGLEAGAHTSRSMHAGGVQVLIADGAVRFISDSIDQSIWRAIATADGGESHSDF